MPRASRLLRCCCFTTEPPCNRCYSDPLQGAIRNAESNINNTEFYFTFDSDFSREPVGVDACRHAVYQFTHPNSAVYQINVYWQENDNSEIWVNLYVNDTFYSQAFESGYSCQNPFYAQFSSLNFPGGTAADYLEIGDNIF